MELVEKTPGKPAVKSGQQTIPSDPTAAAATADGPPPGVAPLKTFPKRTKQKSPKLPADSKGPDNLIFRLIKEVNPQLKNVNKMRGMVPRYYAVYQQTILWPYRQSPAGQLEPLPFKDTADDAYVDYGDGLEIDDTLQWLPRGIRYVSQLSTVFVDEQERVNGKALERVNGQNATLDNYANRDNLCFVGWELKIPSGDSLRKTYLWLSNQCENQHPLAKRPPGASGAQYRLLDFGMMDKQKVQTGQLRKKMYDIAETARLAEMIPHAKYLGISFVITETGQTREWDAIREDYKDKALMDPERFRETYDDPKVKILYQVGRLVETGRLMFNGGKAAWSHTGAQITNIPPDRSPVEFMADFSLTTDGREFANQLEAFRVAGVL